MSKEERTTVIVTIIGIAVCIVAFVFVFLWDSERSKRLELEVDLASCELTNEAYDDLLKGVLAVDPEKRVYLYRTQATPDSLLAVPPKDSTSDSLNNYRWRFKAQYQGYSFPSETLRIIDSSEVTDE